MLCAALGLTGLYPLTKYIKNFKGYLPNMLGNFYGGRKSKKFHLFIIPIAWLGIIASTDNGSC